MAGSLLKSVRHIPKPTASIAADKHTTCLEGKIREAGSNLPKGLKYLTNIVSKQIRENSN
jgi:hypothetical protein